MGIRQDFWAEETVIILLGVQALKTRGERSLKSLHPEHVREERDVPSRLYVPKLFVASRFYSSRGSRERRNRSKYRRRRRRGAAGAAITIT